MDALTNIEMEATVLGSILYDNDLVYAAIDTLTADCFFDELHKEIYISIRKLMDEGEKVSPVRLYNKFADVLGKDSKDYIPSLVRFSSPITFKSNIKHLSDLAHRRALSSVCNTALEKLRSFDKQGIEYVSQLIEGATGILAKTSSESITVAQAAENVYKEMTSDIPAYKAKTGLRCIDFATHGGLQRGRVYAFMAAAKCGKTMMATTISGNLNRNGHKHLFVCAEMGASELTQRMLGHRLGVPSSAFHEPSERVQNQLIEEIGVLQRNNNIIFENAPGIEFDELRCLVERHVYKSKIEGFVLDYYQLVSGCEKNGTQAQHLENVANWIHRVCKKHNIWCILLVQTNDQQQVLGSRGLNRACDQGYLIERPLDDKGDPIGTEAWLKMRFSRYTKTYNLGSANNPILQIHRNGTHFEETVREVNYNE